MHNVLFVIDLAFFPLKHWFTYLFYEFCVSCEKDRIHKNRPLQSVLAFIYQKYLFQIYCNMTLLSTAVFPKRIGVFS